MAEGEASGNDAGTLEFEKHTEMADKVVEVYTTDEAVNIVAMLKL